MTDYTQPDTFHPQWIGYLAVLWLLLVILAQNDTLRPLVVALIWTIVIGSLMLIIDPSNPNNLLAKMGLISQ